MPNKGLERSLRELRVRCTHHKSGCDWTGELCMLDKHLNIDPVPRQQLKGCKYTDVKCLYRCLGLFKRGMVAEHQANECPNKPLTCAFCNNYSSTQRDVTENHWPVCRYYRVPCPYNCAPNMLKQEDVEHHLVEECPAAMVSCSFHEVGCKSVVQRRDLSDHLTENHVEHVSLLAAGMSARIARIEQENKALKEGVERENETLKQEVAESRRENRVLRKEIDQLKRNQQGSGGSLVPLYTHIGILPVFLVMPDFTILRNDGEDWESEPFYTHPQGYKMFLRVEADGGWRRPTMVSVYVHLMRGEFDNYLRWPFRGTVTVALLNQLGDNAHYEKSCGFDDESGRRVVGGEYAGGWGWPKFICHHELEYNSAYNCQYLKYGILRFKVNSVQ